MLLHVSLFSLLLLFISQGQKKAEEMNPLVDSVVLEVRCNAVTIEDINDEVAGERLEITNVAVDKYACFICCWVR